MSVEPYAAVAEEFKLTDRPLGLWRWSQHWREVLFVHWAVSREAIQPLLPAGIEVDTYHGSAWVSAVAFRLERVRWRGLPSTPWFSNLLELNLRTYVRHRGESGIYFLSMHADNRAALTLARWLTPLPYASAKIAYDTRGRAKVFACILAKVRDRPHIDRSDPANLESLISNVTHKHGGPALAGSPVSPNKDPLFRAEFEPRDDLQLPTTDSLDAWLLERYRAFVPDRRGRLCRMVVEHAPWQVQTVSLQTNAQGLGEAFRLDLGRGSDVAHFSAAVTARLWPFEAT